MDCEAVVGRLLQRVQSIRGIRGAKLIPRECIGRLKELEAQAEGNVLMGLAKGYNEGVQLVLSREYVIAALTDSSMEWPEEPTVKLFYDDLLVGEEVRNNERLEQYRAAGEMILGTFVIYRDRLRANRGRGNARVVIPHVPLKELEGVEGAKDVVAGSPSCPADTYLRTFFDANEGGLGTLLVGFNLDRG
jgi:hypothetical protein